MMIFTLTIQPEDVTRYMATVIVPGFLRNLRLEPVHFNTHSLNKDGTQALKLIYKAAGRVEELDLDPEEHALPLLREVLPSLALQNVNLVENSTLWTWNDEVMQIHFQVQTPPVTIDEMIPTEEAYLSVSRREIFLSQKLFRRYFACKYAQLGLNFPEHAEVAWNPSVGGILCHAEKVSSQLVFTDTEAIEEILGFAHLTDILPSVESWVNTDSRILLGTSVQIRDGGGIVLPLDGRS